MTAVRFLAEETAFEIRRDHELPDYRKRLTEIIEHWKHYEYSVGKIEVRKDS